MSKGIFDGSVIDAFAADLENTYLVSFPRTGSAWLRMLVELTFDRPTLTRVYYLQDRTDWLFLHTHDTSLDIRRKNVIYLYRDPVQTVYSQLAFTGRALTEQEAARCGDRYGQYLYWWLVAEDFTEKKTVVTYEGMQSDAAGEMRKIAEHFGLAFDEERAKAAGVLASKQVMKSSTSHDDDLLRTDDIYEEERDWFCRTFGEATREAVLRDRPELEGWLR